MADGKIFLMMSLFINYNLIKFQKAYQLLLTETVQYELSFTHNLDPGRGDRNVLFLQ